MLRFSHESNSHTPGRYNDGIPMTFFRLLPCALFAPFLCAQCVQFPAGIVPFSSISYVSAANSSGEQLVVGTLSGGLNTLAQLPPAEFLNQAYCNPPIELAPGQFYPNVFVPGVKERAGDFSAFAGFLFNPTNNQPYPGGIIPANQLNVVYAF